MIRPAMIRPLAEIGLMIVVWAGLIGLPATAHALEADWRWLEIPQSHTSLEYPAGLLAATGPSETGTGETFRSQDGNVMLSVYGQPNRTGETPAGYLENNLRVSPSAIEYKRVTRTFFAISTEREGMVYYSRCNFSSGAPGVLHCFDLAYPQREKPVWDTIVTRISRSLRPLEG